MVNVTYLGETGYCPQINRRVTILGKYRISDDYRTATYEFFTCPIDENAKLHPYDQCEEFKYMQPCKNIYDCPIAKQFKKEVTL